MNPVKIPFPEREMVRPVCRPGEVMRGMKGEESWSEQTGGCRWFLGRSCAHRAEWQFYSTRKIVNLRKTFYFQNPTSKTFFYYSSTHNKFNNCVRLSSTHITLQQQKITKDIKVIFIYMFFLHSGMFPGFLKWKGTRVTYYNVKNCA